jgi:excisionase family DNA binding protein
MPITTKQAADQTGIPLRTVQWAASHGHLAAYRLGRDWMIEPEDLDTWLATRA